MALDVGSILCCCMHREKSLRGSDALEPLHLPLPSSGRLMRILCSIVAPSTVFMASCDPKMIGDRLKTGGARGKGVNLKSVS
jgi:hypothetical protein